MNALTLTLIKLAFLAVLWLFVIAAVGVVRTDLFGPRRRARKARGAGRPARPRPRRRPGAAPAGPAAAPPIRWW